MSNPLDFERAKTDSIIMGFDGHLMNNTKWVKLLNALSDSDLVLESKVKLVWDDELRDFRIRYAGYCHDFYDTNMEAMISGYPKGFYDYKEIEWVDFPAEAEVVVNPDNIKSGTRQVAQDIQAICKIISNIGMFELESSDSNLRLYGYK
ncbi:DUF6678 family protein [Aliikangiella coralliicola]|uniref:Uncharacterized protein n=1 Tax=Aliikangiella coralliicola TaxID=2592383 RepID=A0A545UFN5_9GAMM|nr:DUF6678 family protein [Aliikangiella coralliicola]TQV88286.1 hypothetical protein FLL46_07090 [Aliikangiella coralliicola]